MCFLLPCVCHVLSRTWGQVVRGRNDPGHWGCVLIAVMLELQER